MVSVMRRILRRTFDGPLKYLACQAGSVQSEERICLYFSIRLFTTQNLLMNAFAAGEPAKTPPLRHTEMKALSCSTRCGMSGTICL